MFIEKRRVLPALRRRLERQALGRAAVPGRLEGVSRVHRGVVGGHYGCFSCPRGHILRFWVGCAMQGALTSMTLRARAVEHVDVRLGQDA